MTAPTWPPLIPQWKGSLHANGQWSKSQLSTRPPDATTAGFGETHYSLARLESRLCTWPCWWGGCGASSFPVVFHWSTVVSVEKFSFY